MKPRSDDGHAFIPDPAEGTKRTPDELAETLGEDFVHAATSGGTVDDEVLDSVVPEEVGGPFVVTSAEEEFAAGSDESNPPDAYAEPVPTATAGLATNAYSDEDEEEEI